MSALRLTCPHCTRPFYQPTPKHYGIWMSSSKTWLVDADNRVFATQSRLVAEAQLRHTQNLMETWQLEIREFT